jgi:ATP-dependent Clp protease adaptor protein ClpS
VEEGTRDDVTEIEDMKRADREARVCSSSYASSFASSATGGGPNDPNDPDVPEHEGGEDVDLEDEPVSSVPRRYKVIFHNDDYTTMEFVVDSLKRFFHKTDAEAVHIMLTVHKTGAAVAGVYTRDVAETKAEEVMTYARDNGMPLPLTTEPE